MNKCFSQDLDASEVKFKDLFFTKQLALSCLEMIRKAILTRAHFSRKRVKIKFSC